MWESFEFRLEENERDKPISLRRGLFDVLRSAGLRPGGGVTKKMLSFEFGANERLLWEVQNPSNFFLHEKWRDQIATHGFESELRAFKNGLKDGGRHSALSRDWSFGDENCILIRIENIDTLSRLLGVLMNSENALLLNPSAIRRWIERLRQCFPGLDRFDRPDPHFDETERNYKLETASELRAAVTQTLSDQELADAVHLALAKSNLLQWRAYWPMSPKGDANRDILWPALRRIVEAALGPSDGHAEALEAFVEAWIASVPDGKADPGRQIGEFLFLHLAPDAGIYIRHSVRQALWLESVGSRFPKHDSIADTYRDELRFMEAVRSAFDAYGLAPRDMIDVQSALWIVHNYKDEDIVAFSRNSIETAMDAYDEYQLSDEHSERFSTFGNPRDYWVRSSRNRDNRVYPTKPIVGFILNKTELNGGWGQKSDAAARLHNAGFIIVGEDDAPVAPPEKYDHLIRDADRIRLCALNYFIEPAREQGEAEVSIRASDLAAAMGLQDAFPNICQALGGEKFQQLAQVPPPTHTGPNPSSSTIFTYTLATQAEAQSMTDETTASSRSATNLILYGPPGTGKTYRTAWEAVRLCLGEQRAAELKGNDKRDALMAEYRRLVSEGLVEFTTFHQSMSYEEFVEGLRPSTGDDAAEGPEDVTINTGGFRLKPHDGVFKRISERARLNRSFRDDPIQRSEWHRDDDSGPDNDGATPNVFDGNSAEAVIDIEYLDLHELPSGQLFLSGDLPETINRENNQRRLVQAVIKYLSDQFPKGFAVNQLKEALDAASEQTGIRPQGGWSTWPAWLIRRKWIEEVTAEDEGSATLTNDATEAHGDRHYVLIIDEINRANISKVFGELITLLEPDKRLGMQNEIRLVLPYSKMSFGVPANLHIIGTMNTADRSIALLDTALRRRFTFRELMPDPTVLSKNVDGINLRALLTTINDRIEYLFDREHQIGHAYFTGCRTRSAIADVMRYKVIPLLAEYFYEDWSKVAVVLGETGKDEARFIESEPLKRPDGMAEDDFSGERLRWRVKDQFDFSEFEV